MPEKIKKKLALDKVRPPKDQNVARYAAVLLKSVKSDFRAFGEGLSSLNEKVERVEEKADATFEELGRFKIESTVRFDRIEVQLDRIEGELLSVKTEIHELKQSLTKKADIAKLQGLEQRVKVIEQALKIRHLTQ